MDAPSEMRYKAGEVCRMADVQPYVLRYWESEFSVLAPERGAPGPRLYTARDVRIIERIKKLLYDEGYTIAGAKKRLEGELKGTEPTIIAKAPEMAPAPPPEPPRRGTLRGTEARARVAEEPRVEPLPRPAGASADTQRSPVDEVVLAKSGDAIAQAPINMEPPPVPSRPARGRKTAAEPVATPILFEPEPEPPPVPQPEPPRSRRVLVEPLADGSLGPAERVVDPEPFGTAITTPAQAPVAPVDPAKRETVPVATLDEAPPRSRRPAPADRPFDAAPDAAPVASEPAAAHAAAPSMPIASVVSELKGILELLSREEP
jgi:DNA-binding transcriptional MerR regulator